MSRPMLPCVTLCPLIISPKTVKILALKGLIKKWDSIYMVSVLEGDSLSGEGDILFHVINIPYVDDDLCYPRGKCLVKLFVLTSFTMGSPFSPVSRRVQLRSFLLSCILGHQT